MIKIPIVVVEGAAGSGKSTLTQMLHDDLSMKRIVSSLTNRNPQSDEAAMKSWENDIWKLVEALKLQSQDGVVIDRLALSQWVYGTLRRNPSMRIRRDALTSWKSMEGLVSALWEDLTHRLAYSGIDLVGQPSIMLVGLQPSIDKLVVQRTRTERQFPWPAEKEHKLYSDAFSMVGGAFNRQELIITDAFRVWPFPTYGQLLAEVEHFVRGRRP